MRTSIHYPSCLNGTAVTRTFRSAYAACIWMDKCCSDYWSIDYYYTATNFVTLTRRELGDLQESVGSYAYVCGIPAHRLPLAEVAP